MQRIIIMEIRDDNNNVVATSQVELEKYLEITHKTGLDMIAKTFHDLQREMNRNNGETKY
jgi:hypothetical protein